MYYIRAQDEIAPLVELPCLLIKMFYVVLFDLHTDLQAVAARISFGKTVTVCNIYLPPSVPVRGADLYHLFEQLPRPFVVVGDLNGHNPLWGSDHCDSRGRLFEEVFNDLNLCILNDGSPTYCHPASGSKSVDGRSFIIFRPHLDRRG